MHIDAIVQIINNPDLKEAETSQQIAEVLASAVKTVGLMYLGRVAGKQNRNNTDTSTSKPQVEAKKPTYNQQFQISSLSKVLPQDLQGYTFGYRRKTQGNAHQDGVSGSVQ